MPVGAVARDPAVGAGDDQRQDVVLDPAAAALLEVALDPAGHLRGHPGGHPLQVDQRQVVLGHPAERPQRPEKRDLTAPPQIPQEQPAGVAGDQRPVDIEEGANLRHGVGEFIRCVTTIGARTGEPRSPRSSTRFERAARI